MKLKQWPDKLGFDLGKHEIWTGNSRSGLTGLRYFHRDGSYRVLAVPGESSMTFHEMIAACLAKGV